MSPTPNGTDAKDIALYFIKLTQGRATPSIIAKTIRQAKTLLSHEYTKQEIIEVIDYIILEKKYDVYSLGYINTCINDVLREIKKKKEQEELQKKKEEVRKQLASEVTCSEVKDDGKSTERNRKKARRLGVQSRFREKFNLDMFEGQ